MPGLHDNLPMECHRHRLRGPMFAAYDSPSYPITRTGDGYCGKMIDFSGKKEKFRGGLRRIPDAAGGRFKDGGGKPG